MCSSVTLENVTLLTGEKVSLAIEGGVITHISKKHVLSNDHKMDCSNLYVSSGWIDLHVHAFAKHDPYGDDIDEIGIKRGVTTIVDAGSCGTDQFSQLMDEQKKHFTNVLAFLNISKIGLQRIDELSRLEWIDQQGIIETFTHYEDEIVGLKVRMSKSVAGNNGIIPLKMARQIADEVNLPLMVHIGSGPPDIRDIVSLLRKGDVITHYLHGKNNGLFTETGHPLPVLIDAINRGVLLDVGHGTASFSFRVAEMAKKHGIKFNTISTDIYRDNRDNGPVYSLAHTLTKFLELGYSLKEIIHAVTESPAKWLDRPELAQIKEGIIANLTLFSLEDEPITLTDSEGEQRKATKQIIAKGVVINGKLITY